MRGTDNLLSKYDTFGSHLFAFCSFRNMFTASITRQGDAVDRSLLKSVLGMLCSLNVSQSLQLFTDCSIVGLGSRAVLMFWLPACFSASLGNIFSPVKHIFSHYWTWHNYFNDPFADVPVPLWDSFLTAVTATLQQWRTTTEPKEQCKYRQVQTMRPWGQCKYNEKMRPWGRQFVSILKGCISTCIF